MANFTTGAVTRRGAFRFAVAAALGLWAESNADAANFWIKKKASEWTDEEKIALRTKSPWAKKIDAEMARGGGGGAAGGGGDSSDGGGGGRGGGGGGRGGGGGGGGRGGGGDEGPGGAASPSTPPTVSVTMVWQSAAAAQDAHKIAFPASLDNHYVIMMTGVPTAAVAGVLGLGGRGGGGRRGGGQRGGGSGGGNQQGGSGSFGGGQAAGGEGEPPAQPQASGPTPEAIERLKHSVSFVVKGKPSVNPDVVLQANNGAVLLFGLAKDSFPLAVSDKEVDIQLVMGGLTGKAKFNLKDMMYEGNLSL